MTPLSLRTAPFFSDEVGGDAKEQRLGVSDLAARLVGSDAEVSFLNDVIDACDAQMAEATGKPSGVLGVKFSQT